MFNMFMNAYADDSDSSTDEIDYPDDPFTDTDSDSNDSPRRQPHRFLRIRQPHRFLRIRPSPLCIIKQYKPADPKAHADCPVCLVPTINDTALVFCASTCGTIFHRNCSDQALKFNTRCPMCRSPADFRSFKT